MEIVGVVTSVRRFDPKAGRDGKPLPEAAGIQVEGLNVLVFGAPDPDAFLNKRVSVTVQASYDSERRAVNVRALGLPRVVE